MNALTLDIDALIQNHRLLMVGGKGGVGKTTTSAAIACRAAQMGRKVLLVSTDPAHSLGDAFGCSIGNRVRCMESNLYAMELDPDEEVERYLDKVSSQMRRFAGPDQFRELEKQLRLSRQSPGAQEAALLERLSQIIDQETREYDLVIFDTAPTGHTLRLLSLPEVMAAWTSGLLKHNHKAQQLGKVLDHLSPGKDLDSPLQDPATHANQDLDPRSQQIADTLLARQRLFHRARRQLSDADKTGFLFVMTPEKLPILETRRAVDSLTESGIPVSGIILNRVLPDHVDGAFFAARLKTQQRHLDEINTLFSSFHTLRIPLQEDDVQGMAAIRLFSKMLSQP
ncbi:MAG: ArsA family ATPase [Pseudomonadota bacterium]|nr:ArsA family ATPase [Pseudomonadota bacterium]MEE3320197.1 ArsA family ATPase [Pseudomonadota bacterium]